MTPTEILAKREHDKAALHAEERALIARRLRRGGNYLRDLEHHALLPTLQRRLIRAANTRLESVVDFVSDSMPT